MYALICLAKSKKKKFYTQGSLQYEVAYITYVWELVLHPCEKRPAFQLTQLFLLLQKLIHPLKITSNETPQTLPSLTSENQHDRI